MPQTPQYISISELNRLLNLTLEREFPQIYFEGEISQLTRASSGHLYLTLKDQDSQVSAVLWAGTARGLGFSPEAGDSVVCQGRPNVFQKRGSLQIVVNKMQPAGAGALQKKFLELKQKLELRGLFATERKRPLPFLPKAIGIVTSMQGAAVHDIMKKIRERMPSQVTYLIDVRVQGDGSAIEIAAAIRQFSESGLVDVIIAGRGGGSLEDLWAFNEEVVVQAIFDSRVPVISAVGHEVDITLADLVADQRAPTPTAAGEMVVPHREALMVEVDDLSRRLFDVDRWFKPLEQNVDELQNRMVQRVRGLMEENRLHLSTAQARLQLLEPRQLLKTLGQKLERLASELRAGFSLQSVSILKERAQSLEHRLHRATHNDVVARSRILENMSARLRSASPQQVLERGYALIESEGTLVTSTKSLKENQKIKISLVDGKVGARVTELQK